MGIWSSATHHRGVCYLDITIDSSIYNKLGNVSVVNLDVTRDGCVDNEYIGQHVIDYDEEPRDDIRYINDWT